MEKSPERTCVICRAKKLRKELFRFLVNKGDIAFDKEQKGEGRSFYICSQKCWENGSKQKRKIRVSSRENKFITLPEKTFEEMMRV